MKPARCCVQTLKGTRCANEPSPVRPSRMIGPVRLAACGLDGHQRALWSLPGFVRHDAYCGAFGCDRPSNAGICPKHRDMYRDFGITEHMLFAQEAPMTEPTTTPPTDPKESAGVGATPSGGYLACITPGCGDEDLSDLDQTTGLCGMCVRQKERATAPPATVEDFLRDLESGDGEPSVGDVADAQPTDPMQQRREAVVARLLALGAEEQPGRHPTARVFALKYEAYVVPDVSYSAKDMEAAMQSVERACDRLESFMAGRWSQKHTAPLDGLAALAARGQPPTAPGTTVAELQAELKEATRLSECRRKEVQRRGEALARMEAELAAERARADLCDAEAVSQRQRADAAEEQLRAIAALLDPEDSPAFDANDQPIPLPRRVEVALMPDPDHESELRKSLRAVEDELFEADRALHTLGAYGTGPTKERLLQVLTPEDRRALLEFDAAEARMDLARLNARARLNPAPPERVAELVAKVATLDARIAALDAG